MNTDIDRVCSQLKKLYGGDSPRREEAVKMLELISRDCVNQIIEELKEDHKNIVLDIQQTIVFDDLIQLHKEAVKKLSAHLESRIIGLALRMGGDELRESLLNKLPGSVRDEVESILNGPPQKKVEVEAAVRKIMLRIKELQKKGLVNITPSIDELLV